MPLPTLSLRAAPEHHKLIRDLAAALRTRPELADVLRDVLQAQHGTAARMTERDAAVLLDVVERLSHAEQRIAALEASAPLGSHLRNSADSGERAAILRPTQDTAQAIYESFIDSDDSERTVTRDGHLGHALDSGERAAILHTMQDRTVTRGGTTYPMDTPATARPSSQPAQARPKQRPGLQVPEDVQQRVREMRAAGKTRAAIAAELGISTGAVSKYMNAPAD
jgi:DNA-binding NarL/FixJ family response regulator